MRRREKADQPHDQIGTEDLVAAGRPPAGDPPPTTDDTVRPDNNGAHDPLAEDHAAGITADSHAERHHDPAASDPDTIAGRPVGESGDGNPPTEPADTRDPRTAGGPSHRRQAGPRERREDDDHVALFEDADSERFRGRWRDVQAAFVDDPRRAVQDADQLVAELMRTLAAAFAKRKQSLDSQWRNGGDAETEDLRQALRRYRSFFDQLLPR